MLLLSFDVLETSSFAFETPDITHAILLISFLGTGGVFKHVLKAQMSFVIITSNVVIVKTLKKDKNRNNIAIENGICVAAASDIRILKKKAAIQF